jgi:hypothetical protein
MLKLESRVLRRMFVPKRDYVTGEWIKLHNEELNGLYCSPNIIGAIQSGKMKGVGHVARMGRAEVYRGFWWGNRRGKGHLEDPP